MTIDQPNNAADTALPADARDDRRAASVLAGEQPGDASVGGGGALGHAEERATDEAARGASPNAPLADAMGQAGEHDASAEARMQATATRDG